MPKSISLTQGKFALVDDEDFEWLNQWKWQAQKDDNTFYATRLTSSGGRKRILMHRAILGLAGANKMLCDHKDHDGLNNTRQNLRVCTPSQNQANRRTTNKNWTSIYIGVSRKITKVMKYTYNYWYAQITKNGKKINIGIFKTEREAALAYNKKSLELNGEFATLNKIKKESKKAQ